MTQIAATLFAWNALEARLELNRLSGSGSSAGLGFDHSSGSETWSKSGGLPSDFYVEGIIAGVVFQHEPIELLQRELSRNPSLLLACGFNVLQL